MFARRKKTTKKHFKYIKHKILSKTIPYNIYTFCIFEMLFNVVLLKEYQQSKLEIKLFLGSVWFSFNLYVNILPFKSKIANLLLFNFKTN